MSSTAVQSDLSAWITRIIQDFCDGPENTLRDVTNERAWDAPLVGFANGADHIFEVYKNVVGPFHWTPLEIFNLAHPGVSAKAEDLTVIVMVLPQTTATKRDNSRQTVYLAERWARSRVFGEQFNGKLRQHVAATLTAAGYPAVAPSSAPQAKIHDSEKYVYASTWSERHAAHAAGLGTFGLCDGLITPVGKAVRISSVVARIAIAPTFRPYTDYRAYCLFFSHGTCGNCIDRCPAGALSEAGHDKVKCKAHLDVSRLHVKENYGFDGYGCGLCQVGVPCESGIPNAKNEVLTRYQG